MVGKIVTRKAVLNTVMGKCLAEVFYVLWLEEYRWQSCVGKYDSVIRITFTILSFEGRKNWKLAVAKSITINRYWKYSLENIRVIYSINSILIPDWISSS